MAKEKVQKYSKTQLIKSERYSNRRDLIGAVLKDNELYSLSEVDTAVLNYEKRSVK